MLFIDQAGNLIDEEGHICVAEFAEADYCPVALTGRVPVVYNARRPVTGSGTGWALRDGR